MSVLEIPEPFVLDIHSLAGAELRLGPKLDCERGDFTLSLSSRDFIAYRTLTAAELLRLGQWIDEALVGREPKP